MQVSIQTDIQPSELEQWVVSTVQGLRKLEELFPYSFEETIYQIETLSKIQMNKRFPKPLTGEQLRQADGVCPRHHVELEIAQYGNPDADRVCPKCEAEATDTDALEQGFKAESGVSLGNADEVFPYLKEVN